MRDPDLFGRIDRVIAECDASGLPPLTPADFDGARVFVTDTGETLEHRNGTWVAALNPAGDAEHLVVVEASTKPRRRIRWPWSKP